MDDCFLFPLLALANFYAQLKLVDLVHSTEVDG